MNQDESQYYVSVAACETKRHCRNWPQDGPGRDPSRQFFTQKFWVKSESTLIFLNKNLSLERKITANFDSRQKYPFGTNVEFYRECIYLQLMPIEWHELSRIMEKMWYFVGSQPSKCRNTHIQPLWSSWPIFQNDSETLPKVCYINWKNSEMLSRVGSLLPIIVYWLQGFFLRSHFLPLLSFAASTPHFQPKKKIISLVPWNLKQPQPTSQRVKVTSFLK